MSRRDTDHRDEDPAQNSDKHGSTVGVINDECQADPASHTYACEESMELMEQVVRRENVMAAWSRVKRNKGAAGVDAVSIEEFMPYAKLHWPRLKEELLSDRYKPQPVRRVSIPKPNGGERTLGIPTVLDRLIQQALLQILQPIFDPHFSEHSYGFRPRRSAHGAALAARDHVRDGYRWSVDIDLESFFDRVNHDVLMARVARRIKDKRVLRLIRRYLQAGMFDDGFVMVRKEGTPQGGPLSPLLSNILLDEWDKELERRGHRFVRYADDCNIYVRSSRAGNRVLESMEQFLAKRLRLKINRKKSGVSRPWNTTFLGYSFTHHLNAQLRVAPSSVLRLKAKLKALFRRGRGQSLVRVVDNLKPVLRGWFNYFSLNRVKSVFAELDQWLRRRLRVLIWRRWKRAKIRMRMLRRRGLDPLTARRSAYNHRGAWWNAGASHMNLAFPIQFFHQLGLVSLLDEHNATL